MFYNIKSFDEKLYDYLQKEYKRQAEGIELIASENYVSSNVLEAMGSILTNKYSEGYPKARYYGGNKYIDKIEKLAIKRAKRLFKANYANVQPYSGSPANLAVHFALLKPGDTTMGMKLSAGGHLTHGNAPSFSGTLYNSVNYSVNEEGYLDYSAILTLAKKVKPKLIWFGASAYPRVIDFKECRKIADSVDAIMAVDIAHIAGLVVTGLHPNPFPYADVVTTTTHKTLRGPRGAIILTNNEEIAKKINKAIFPGLQGGPHNHVTAAIAVALKEANTKEFFRYSKQVISNASTLSFELMKLGWNVVTGGTDNHIILIDLTKSKIPEMTGKVATKILEKVNISVNKNAIPQDPRKPWDPSGIRIGTPAVTTRGMKENDMLRIANFIDDALTNHMDRNTLYRIKEEVVEFASKFPLPTNEK